MEVKNIKDQIQIKQLTRYNRISELKDKIVEIILNVARIIKKYKILKRS